MYVLVYLIRSLSSLLSDNVQENPVKIHLGSVRTEKSDEEQLQCFSDILLEENEDDAYDLLRTNLPVKWLEGERYDTVNPFGDERQCFYQALWTFNIDSSILTFTNRHGRKELRLSTLCERVVSFDEMQPIGQPFPTLLLPVNGFKGHIWVPQVKTDPRLRAFTHRLLRDFNYQWRHILRNDYRMKTLHILAKAIVALTTLEFDIYEDVGDRFDFTGSNTRYVDVLQLPNWEPFPSPADIVLIGQIYVVLCLSLSDGISKMQKHSIKHRVSDPVLRYKSLRPNYMILSIKQIMLCQVQVDGTLKGTDPELLFNGNCGARYLTEKAMDYLIWGLHSESQAIPTPLQGLPIEIQDQILDYLSPGKIIGGKIGCILGVGSPFLWKYDALDIQLQEVWRRRAKWSPPESQISLDDRQTGLIYKPEMK